MTSSKKSQKGNSLGTVTSFMQSGLVMERKVTNVA